MAAAPKVMQTPSENVLVGPEYPMLPKRLVDEILGWDFIDLVEFLPPTSAHDTYVCQWALLQLVYPFFEVWAFQAEEETNRHYHWMSASIHNN